MPIDEDFDPISYTIELTPYFDNEGDKSFTFDGHVILTFHVNNDGLSSLRLNSYAIFYGELPTIRDLSATPATITVTNINYEVQIVEFVFDQNLVSGRDYEISIVYTGVLTDEMTGFYRSSYEELGETV